MSYATIITFQDGLPHGEVEYRNAFGGAARIWTAVYDAYLKDPRKMYDSWLMSAGSGGSPLWKLPYDHRLERFEKVVHAATFDNFYIAKKDYKQYAEDLRAFVEKYPVDGRVDHLSDWADFVESCEYEAIGFYGTSVSENPWEKYNEDTDSHDQTPLSEGHDTYKWIEEISKTPVENS